MLISALVSLYAAFVLSIDAVKLASNPNLVLDCDISKIVSCTTVAQSWQASLFGFPNAFLGLITEPVIITLAIAGLSGVKFPKAFLIVAQIVYFFGLSFALWLFLQSSFSIGAFCPYCLLITIGTILTFFTLLRYNLKNEIFPKFFQKLSEFVLLYRLDSSLALLIIGGVFLTIFWEYGFFIFN
jgi:uncharacterized membrane protein